MMASAARRVVNATGRHHATLYMAEDPHSREWSVVLRATKDHGRHLSAGSFDSRQDLEAALRDDSLLLDLMERALDQRLLPKTYRLVPLHCKGGSRFFGHNAYSLPSEHFVRAKELRHEISETAGARYAASR